MKLGRYEVVRELGKGAMGIVYLAKDPLIGRLVALKTIRLVPGADDTETREFQQRFIREAQAAGILNHPAIVTVHDIGQDEATGMSFIAMEYVDGQNLKEILAQGRTLSLDYVGEIIAIVADGLDFAHSKGIVHRDVKPANIILLERRAKITDFGIAKIASGSTNLTSTGQFLGTPNYMAPEQVKGSPVDGRTDIFALGVCLYECLTRRKPFGGDSLTSISYKIVHEPFPPIREIDPTIPEAFEEIVGRALAKEPGRRYQRASEMAADLRAAMRGERPAKKPDPLLVEETVLTSGSSNAPTVETRLPEVEVPPKSKAAKGKVQRATLRMPVPPALFFGVIAIAVLALIIGVVAIRAGFASVPAVDRASEMRSLQERRLRTEGNALIRAGRIRDAYVKYAELGRLAPDSPHVAVVLSRMQAVLRQQDSSRQQQIDARQKYDQAQKLFNVRKFEEAIELLQQSFSLNPNDNDTVELLKLAQVEQQRARPTRARDGAMPAAAAPRRAPGSGPSTTQPATAAAVSRLTTVIESRWADGYIMVKAGGDTLVHEPLYSERARVFRRRAPRTVNVTKEFPAKSADLQIWVIVPSQKISEYRLMPYMKFAAGSSHRLLVAFDQATRTFRYEFN